jgi:hypothetical protein
VSVVHFDNANVPDTSISWYEADKEQVITASSFCPTGNTAGLLLGLGLHVHLTATGKQGSKMSKNFIINLS